MKKFLYTLLTATTLFGMNSCDKTDDTEIDDSKFTTTYTIKNLKFTNLYNADDVMARLYRKYSVVTSAGDTTELTLKDSFRVANVNGFDQKLYFNNPDSAINLETYLTVTVVNHRPVQGEILKAPTVSSIKLQHNKVLIDELATADKTLVTDDYKVFSTRKMFLNIK